jgi:hypothetical protein
LKLPVIAVASAGATLLSFPAFADPLNGRPATRYFRRLMKATTMALIVGGRSL